MLTLTVDPGSTRLMINLCFNFQESLCYVKTMKVVKVFIKPF